MEVKAIASCIPAVNYEILEATAASQSFSLTPTCQQGFFANIPPALLQRMYICLQCVCACLYNNVYLPRGVPWSVVTLALREQMEKH